MHSGRRRGSKGRNACRLPAQPRGPGRREHVEILRAGVDLPSGGAHWFLCPFPSPFTIKEKNRPLPASCQGSPPLTPPGGACVIEARGLCSQQLMVPPEAINQAGAGRGGVAGMRFGRPYDRVLESLSLPRCPLWAFWPAGHWFPCVTWTAVSGQDHLRVQAGPRLDLETPSSWPKSPAPCGCSGPTQTRT